MRRTFLACALLLSMLSGCKYSSPAWMNMPPPIEQHGVQVKVEGVKRLSYWFLGISGEASNVSGKDYQGCTITIDCLDSLGSKVGRATATCDEFEDGAVWNFTADFDTGNVKDVEIVAAPIVRVKR